jgi:voltage-gated potassium channel
MSQLLAWPFRNLAAGVIILLMISAAATAAYVAYGWDLDDAVYMVVITVFSVGYGEVAPVDTPALRAITIALIVAGCTAMVFITGSLVQLITASQLRQFFGARKMQKDISDLSGHVIICGYGRIGQMLAQELKAARSRFVVVECSEDRIAAAKACHYFCLKGDATDEEVLKHAGVLRARAVATVLPEDAANVFITLSARALNPGLTIIARGEIPSTESKLIQAGADCVVLPARIGAERMAELLLYKDVTQIIADTKLGNLERLATDLQRLGLDIEVVTAEAGSRCVGATIAEIESLGAGTFLIVALERRDGETILQPHHEIVIDDGDGVALVARPGSAQPIELVFAAPKVTDEPSPALRLGS